MRTIRWIPATMMSLALAAIATPVQPQGKGQDRPKPEQAKGRDADKAQKGGARGQEARATGQAQGRGKAQDRAADAQSGQGRGQARGQQDRPTGRENAAARRGAVGEAGGEVERGRGRSARVFRADDVRPSIRKFVESRRAPERLAGRVLAVGHMRGLSDDAVVITPDGERVFIRNRAGDVLLDLDDDRARKIGGWKVVALDDREKTGSPAFCRSGAGHPVWGRQWCVDKGFNIGTEQDIRWSRAVDPGRIILTRRTDSGNLTRDVLATVLGDVVLNRLALHAIALGLDQPLAGRWLGEPAGPRVLLVSSGDRAVAEIVDVNRDERADVLLVALRP